MKTKMNARLTRALVAALVVCMLACTMLSTVAFAANQAVNDASTGVLQVNLVYTNDANKNIAVAWGTGFLVNDRDLVTCYHVTHLDDDEILALATNEGKTEAEIKSRLSITVTIIGDTTRKATILAESRDMDFTVLRLESSLNGKTPLKIRDPQNPVQKGESVWSIGFPSLSDALQDYSPFNSEDTTVTNGTVNKFGTASNPWTGAINNYYQTSVGTDYGNSGGPLLDDNGYVIGYCQGFVKDDAVSYYYSVNISHVLDVLNPLGIPYETGVGPTPVVTEPVETQAPETQAPETQAPETQAPETKPIETLPPIDDEEGGLDTKMILIIAAVAVAVIVVIVVVVVAGGKKKKAPAPAPAPAPRPVTPVAPNAGFAPVAPTYPTQDAGETTVLGGGAGETTVLSRNTVNGGTLIRKRTGESISINTDKFVIGRERKSVNYCISDNNSVSRNHITLTVRSGVTFLTDMNAANGTFVNGVKVPPRQEIALKNGDKITLADEDLEYKN